MLTLLNLLDSSRVSPHVRTEDKHPNIDGYLILIDACQPQGKFEVQIKTLRAGDTALRCPSSLVAYTRDVTTLPVILIGVDATSGRAFWVHMSDAMTGYKPEQKTFTVHFTEELDFIDRSAECPCYQAWLALAQEYQRRVNAVNPTAQPAPLILDSEQWAALQRFVQTVNDLLDHEFVSVKRVLFHGVGKFRIGARLLDRGLMAYQLAEAPARSTEPIAFELGADETSVGPDVYTRIWLQRQAFFSAPEPHARAFVHDLLKKVFQERSFPVHGAILRRTSCWGSCAGTIHGSSSHATRTCLHLQSYSGRSVET